MAVAQVVSSDGMTAIRHKPVNICDVCGFQWVRRPGPDPERCASQECRSVFWNRGKKAIAEWNAKEKKPGRPKKIKAARARKRSTK